MKFIALTECPQGQMPGEMFETTEAMGHVLELVGAARRVEGDEAAAVPVTKGKARKGTYQRRDLVAESNAHLGADHE